MYIFRNKGKSRYVNFEGRDYAFDTTGLIYTDNEKFVEFLKGYFLVECVSSPQSNKGDLKHEEVKKVKKKQIKHKEKTETKTKKTKKPE